MVNHAQGTAMKRKKGGHNDALLSFLSIVVYLLCLIEDCAAASLAIGTLKGEQLT
jgi:hypothetical protein